MGNEQLMTLIDDSIELTNRERIQDLKNKQKNRQAQKLRRNLSQVK